MEHLEKTEEKESQVRNGSTWSSLETKGEVKHTDQGTGLQDSVVKRLVRHPRKIITLIKPPAQRVQLIRKDTANVETLGIVITPGNCQQCSAVYETNVTWKSSRREQGQETARAWPSIAACKKVGRRWKSRNEKKHQGVGGRVRFREKNLHEAVTSLGRGVR